MFARIVYRGAACVYGRVLPRTIYSPFKTSRSEHKYGFRADIRIVRSVIAYTLPASTPPGRLPSRSRARQSFQRTVGQVSAQRAHTTPLNGMLPGYHPLPRLPAQVRAQLAKQLGAASRHAQPARLCVHRRNIGCRGRGQICSDLPGATTGRQIHLNPTLAL